MSQASANKTPWERARAYQASLTTLGAIVTDADYLQPADILLDLYGEDIRARAFTTQDPGRGEMMLRPDFTVPIAQAHMRAASATDAARYTYMGKVFRKQGSDSTRPSEFVQVGFEIFGSEDPAKADAEVFAALAGLLQGLPVVPVSGDMGILRAAVMGLETTAARRSALMRHLWRPRRFKALLDRFGGLAPMPPARAALLAKAEPMADMPPLYGLRSRAEIAARIEALRLDAAAPPISRGEREGLDALLSIREMSPIALKILQDIAKEMPSIVVAVSRFAARLDALVARGISVDSLPFEASFGRSSMEYYDGFVFDFAADQVHGLPAVASGGRYDALTAILGGGTGVPAVGGVVRPELISELEG